MYSYVRDIWAYLRDNLYLYQVRLSANILISWFVFAYLRVIKSRTLDTGTIWE